MKKFRNVQPQKFWIVDFTNCPDLPTVGCSGKAYGVDERRKYDGVAKDKKNTICLV